MTQVVWLGRLHGISRASLCSEISPSGVSEQERAKDAVNAGRRVKK